MDNREKQNAQTQTQIAPWRRNSQEHYEACVRHYAFKAARDSVPKTTLQLKAENFAQEMMKPFDKYSRSSSCN